MGHGDHGDRAEVPRGRVTQQEPSRSRSPGGTITNRVAKRFEAVADEVVANMALTRTHARPRSLDRLVRDGALGPVAARRQVLHDLAVAVARIEIHAGIRAG